MEFWSCLVAEVRELGVVSAVEMSELLQRNEGLRSKD